MIDESSAVAMAAAVTGQVWQRCPVCEGHGQVMSGLPTTEMHGDLACPTCHGQRIISVATGRPPEPDIRLDPVARWEGSD